MTGRKFAAASAEEARLAEDAARDKNWKRWGPYLAERQWGTVREDYSEHGTSWEDLPHDHARSRAYRWGEDGILGITDRECRLCFAIALWNGKDSILKERFFGLTGPQGNHGEDVKECYYYLDSTPTHSYMKALYKYPHDEFPYARLIEESRNRGKRDPEFELIDTGIFEGGRYFDVFVEYAKASPDDILIRVCVENRGDESATLTLLPTLWFRNTWSWGRQNEEYGPKPQLRLDKNGGLDVFPSRLAPLLTGIFLSTGLNILVGVCSYRKRLLSAVRSLQDSCVSMTTAVLATVRSGNFSALERELCKTESFYRRAAAVIHMIEDIEREKASRLAPLLCAIPNIRDYKIYVWNLRDLLQSAHSSAVLSFKCDAGHDRLQFFLRVVESQEC